MLFVFILINAISFSIINQRQIPSQFLVQRGLTNENSEYYRIDVVNIHESCNANADCAEPANVSANVSAKINSYYYFIDKLSSDRLTLLANSFFRFKNEFNLLNIIYGVGPNNFYVLNSADAELVPHNFFVRFFSEFGIFGLLLSLYIGWNFLMRRASSIARWLCAMGIIASLLQPNAFLIGLNTFLPFWIIYSLDELSIYLVDDASSC